MVIMTRFSTLRRFLYISGIIFYYLFIKLSNLFTNNKDKINDIEHNYKKHYEPTKKPTFSIHFIDIMLIVEFDCK